MVALKALPAASAYRATGERTPEASLGIPHAIVQLSAIGSYGRGR
jgi:hypothetical protein